MLKELWSPTFKEQGERRRPIIFKPGLNVILGANEGDNSIGKSSTLLAIDFAFGGDTYLDSDGVKIIGHHEVFFCFEFDNQDFRFMRSTQDPDVIHLCDSQYIPTGNTISKKEFCDRLKTRYNLDFPGLELRKTLSSFFRIYGKDNYKEHKPLAGISGPGMRQQLEIVIKLFNMYGGIALLDQKRDEARQIASAFKKAQDYRFLPSDVNNKTKAVENEIRIKELKEAQEQLRNSEARNVTAHDLEEDQQRRLLMQQIEEINAEITKQTRHLNLVKTSLDVGLYPRDADLDALLTFFPEANLKKIYEIEGFHKNLAGILASEFEEDHRQTKAKIEELVQVREELHTQLLDFGSVPTFSKEFLDTFSELGAEISRLEKQNEVWEKYQQIEEKKKETERSYNRALQDVLKSIEYRINERLKALNTQVVGPYRWAPKLTIRAYDGYSFETPRDTGTGTNFRGLVLYDIAVLQETALPAICEDSLVMKNIDDSSIEGIFKLYESMTNKQVFIAFDKADKYTSDVLRIAQDNTVLKLYRDGGELYGTAWNKEENKQ